jgi:hypothetical protein
MGHGHIWNPHTSSTLVFRIPFSHVQYLETSHRHMHGCCRLDKRIFNVKAAESEPKLANRKKCWSWASLEQLYTTSWSDYLSGLSLLYMTIILFLHFWAKPCNMDHMAEQSKNKSSQKSCILYTTSAFSFLCGNFTKTWKIQIEWEYSITIFPFMGKKSPNFEKKIGVLILIW